MRELLVVVAVAMAAAVAVPAVANETAATDAPWVTKTYMVRVAPGGAAAFDAAMREHMELHRKAGDPQPVHAYQVINGKDHGLLIFRQTVHGWGGFDVERKIAGDETHLQSKVLPHTSHVASHLAVWQPDISRWPEDLPEPALVEVTVFRLTYDGARGFFHAISRLHEVIGEKAPHWRYSWEMVVNGADGPTMVLAIPHEDWASFAEPSPPLWKMAEEALGEYGAQRLRETIASAIAREESFVVAARPDLSYVPAGK